MKWHLKCISISESRQQSLTFNSLKGFSPLSSARRYTCLNLTDMADKQDSSDREDPMSSVSPSDPLWPPALCHDATVTATVTGGACDLCLTNGSFIIVCATGMSPVFIALYFKLIPQWCPSIMVTHDLYSR